MISVEHTYNFLCIPLVFRLNLVLEGMMTKPTLTIPLFSAFVNILLGEERIHQLKYFPDVIL